MKAYRSMIFALANCTCQLCGAKVTFFNEGLGGYQDNEGRWHISTNPLQIHHIDHDIKNNLPSNLVLCCYECHKRLHVSSEQDSLLEWFYLRRKNNVVSEIKNE